MDRQSYLKLNIARLNKNTGPGQIRTQDFKRFRNILYLQGKFDEIAKKFDTEVKLCFAPFAIQNTKAAKSKKIRTFQFRPTD